ncbi:restriction endonuclease subunit S [Campylobacter devanensis]|uniref:restriction endonuclease subunit S n=1 Tax=Campylobacter devanensis TaxID=3161138 RepID=UPI000BB44A37|nr:restriction endonuclease subunit S [Campylobacter sp. P0088]
MAKIKKDTNLRKSILQAAITGQLISNVKGETKTGKELLDKIIEERNAKLLAQWEEAKKKNPKAKKPTPIVASEITEDEIPFEIPKNWCWCRLGDLVLFGECENAEPNEIEDDAWILDLEDIEKDSGRIIQFKKKKEIDSKSTKHIFKEGNVLYSKLRPYLNKCVIAPKDGYCTSEIIPLDFGKFISNKYAQKFLMSPYFVDYTVSLSYGVKMPRLGTTDGKKALIPLPPLAVQNAIVAKLEEVLPLVDAYENAVLQKEELKTALPDKVKKAILQEAIQGKLTKSWRKTTTIEESGKQLLDKIIEERNAKLLAQWEEAKKKNPKAKKPAPIVASEITEDEIPFEIPESWCWCRLGDLGTFINGDRGSNYPSKDKLSSNGEIPFVSAINFENTTLRKDNLLYVSQKQYDLLRSGKLQKEDFAICIRGSLGKFCFYPLEVGAIASSLVILRANEIINKKYLYYYLCSDFFYEEIKRFNNGTAQPNLAAGDLIKFLFPLPPLAEQEKIVEIIEQMLPLCEKLGG